MTSGRSISLIIPVLNEAGIIEQTIRHHQPFLRPDRGDQLIVVDGGSDDQTAAVLAQQSGVLVLTAERGRGRQLNRGAERVEGDWLLFLHADTQLPAETFRLLRADRFGAGVVGGAHGFALDCAAVSPWRKVLYRMIEIGVNLRTNWLRLPYGDQALFVRREAFRRLGGYREWPILEDLDFVRRMKRIGRLTILPHQARTSNRGWERRGPLRQTLRNWSALLLHLLGVEPAQIHARLQREPPAALTAAPLSFATKEPPRENR